MHTSIHWCKGDMIASYSKQDLVNTVIYSTVVKGFTMSRQHDQVTAGLRSRLRGWPLQAKYTLGDSISLFFCELVWPLILRSWTVAFLGSGLTT